MNSHFHRPNQANSELLNHARSLFIIARTNSELSKTNNTQISPLRHTLLVLLARMQEADSISLRLALARSVYL